MPLFEKIFYAYCISINRFKFSYGRKPKGERLENIMLPIDTSCLHKINFKDLSGDEALGASILKTALEGPARQIIENAGLEASVIVNEVKSNKSNYGFDAREEKYVDMLKSGIIDPTLVTRTAVQNASSIAGLLLTTEAVITDKPEPPDDWNLD